MSQADFEDSIYMILMLRPDHAYVAPGGKKIYILTADQEDVLVIHGEGFDTMDADEINATIQNALKN